MINIYTSRRNDKFPFLARAILTCCYCIIQVWLINGVTNPPQKNNDVMQRQGAHLTMAVKFIPFCGILTRPPFSFTINAKFGWASCAFFLRSWKHFTFLEITKKKSLFYRELAFTKNDRNILSGCRETRRQLVLTAYAWTKRDSLGHK